MKKLLSLSILILFLFAQHSFSQVKTGDFLLGGKVALGGVGGASIGFGVNGEYLMNDDLGLGFVSVYSTYTSPYGIFGDYEYTNLLIAGMITYRLESLRIKNMDIFGAFNLGYNVGSVKYKGLLAGAPSPTHGGFIWGFSANLRYFISPNLALTASVGYGLGFLAIGIDYKL